MAAALVVLAAASSLQIAIPAFEVDGANDFVGRRASLLYARGLEEAGCVGKSIGADEIGPQAAQELASCYGRTSCLASVARTFGASKLVVGSMRRIDASFILEIFFIDVERARAEKPITDRFPSRLDAIPPAVKRGIPELCRALAPDAFALGLDLEDAPAPLPPLEVVEAPAPIAPPPDDLTFTIPTLPARAAEPPPAPIAARELPAPPVVDVPPPPSPDPEPAPVVTARPAPPPHVIESPRAPPVVTPSPPKSPPSMPAPPPIVKPTRAPEKVAVPVKPGPPPKPLVVRWSWIGAGAAGACAIAGGILGASSRATWSSDRPVDVNGRTAHSLSRAEARRANSQAVAANVLFGAAFALGAGSAAAIVLLPDGGPSITFGGGF